MRQFRLDSELRRKLERSLGSKPEKQRRAIVAEIEAAIDAAIRRFEHADKIANADPEWPKNIKAVKADVLKIKRRVDRLLEALDTAPEGVRDLVAGWGLHQGQNLGRAIDTLREVRFSADWWLSQKAGRGSKPDHARHYLESEIGEILARCGIKVTQYRDGIAADCIRAALTVAIGERPAVLTDGLRRAKTATSREPDPIQDLRDQARDRD
jgi:hypothetical protein